MTLKKKLGIGLSILALAAAACSPQTDFNTLPTVTHGPTSTSVATQTAPPVIEENLLDKVKAGTYDVEAYIDEMIKRSPKLTKAIEDSVVAGVLYDPTIPELTDNLRSVLKGNVPDDELEGLIAAQLGSRVIIEGKVQEPTVFPTRNEAYGIGVSSYIVLPKDFFRPIRIQTDDDGISVIEHEVDHAEDYFKPISYKNGVTLTKQDLLSGRVRKPFYEALGETRVFYKQLDGNFRALLDKESKNFGPFIMGENARLYIEAREMMQLSAKTPKEIAIMKAQLDGIKGIVPLPSIDGVMRFQYNLHGYNMPIGIREK